MNVKVIQDTLGHKDILTTLNIYTDVTKELRQSEFEGLDAYFKMSIIKCQMGEGHFIGDDKKRIHHLHQFVLQSTAKLREFIEK